MNDSPEDCLPPTAASKNLLVPEQHSYAPRPIQLPAVLQLAGQAPFFGTIATLSEQGLTFDFLDARPPQQAVGCKARLDFDLQGQHHACHSLLVHLQGSRALLSLRETASAVLAALHSVNRRNAPHLAASLSILQMQHACHTQFMNGMKAVVDSFYRLLSGESDKSSDLARHLWQQATALTALRGALIPLRPALARHFTQAYPMYPELRASYSEAGKTGDPLQLVDMHRVDDWIRRSDIAHRVADALSPLPGVFSLHYDTLLKREHKPSNHPYLPDSVLDVLSELIAPLGLGGDETTLCYELMGQALQLNAAPIYQAMLQVLGDAPPDPQTLPGDAPDLAHWLKEAAQQSAPSETGGAPAGSTADAQISELAALVLRLTESLGELTERQRQMVAGAEHSYSAQMLIPGLLARDRILARFLPALPSTAEENALPPHADWTSAGAFGKALGSLTTLDSTALDGLYAQLMQPPPIDPGPEKLTQASQIRTLMLQAQGLLMEYTLNGLTYHAQPEHPAWALMNALDVLHCGADDRGQLLDPTLYKATSLAMQWLLGQENTDAALAQVNALLVKINTQVLADRQSRRERYLDRLGPPESVQTFINSGWCVIKRDDEAIPHEVLGKFAGQWALLNRSATRLLEIPDERFIQDFDDGRIEEAGSFNEPFLERISNATLTASLNAVHAFTWQDPGSGCLKRTAMMDELERRLAHPVSEPSTFCALIEIPTMRPGLSSLPGDELAVMQKRTGEMLLDVLENGEHCGRLSDVSFLMVFAPQKPDQLAGRLAQLKTDMESLHPEWKMIGAVVPLVGDEASPTPSSVLRRANQACAPLRRDAGFDLSCLSHVLPPSNQIDPLPLSSLYLRCQKIASCDDGAPSHYEILLGVDEALVPSHTTQSFVVMAEQTGRVHDLDKWILRSVLEWMDRNGSIVEALSGLSVNLSGNSLVLADHVEEMASLISSYPLLAKKLILEVTETAAISNLDVAVRSLRKLRKLGCRIALDDFGSGYSSYGYLRSLPLDYLKIDGIYIRNILNDTTDQALTASMIDVAHALGLKVIAEYVDSEATYAWLKDLGVDYVQGYWVHKPERLDGLVLH